jgi:hypothetical protein
MLRVVKGMAVLPVIDDVLKRWRSEGVSLLPPADEASVIAAFDKTGRRYSRDVVALYCATGGMAGGESDARAWSLWRLEQVVSENSSYERPHLLFADFLIHSQLYCFRYESEERSSVCVDYFSGEEPEVLAGSVAEFFDLYLKNPGALRVFD